MTRRNGQEAKGKTASSDNSLLSILHSAGRLLQALERESEETGTAETQVRLWEQRHYNSRIMPGNEGASQTDTQFGLHTPAMVEEQCQEHTLPVVTI